jgi:hypothetical protein
LIFTVVLLLCYGFKIPDTDKLRREFRKKVDAELEKIIEKTPNAKARNKWRSVRDRACEAIEQAELVEADRFAKEDIDDARYFMARAKKYSARREYLKAAYLGKQAIIVAEKAEKKAKQHLDTLYSEISKAIDKCSRALGKIADRLPEDNDVELAFAKLRLELGYARNLLKTGEFEKAKEVSESLYKKIMKFAATIPGSEQQVEEEYWI